MANVTIVQGKLDGGKTTCMKKLSEELIDSDGIITLKDSEFRTYFFHEIRTQLNYIGLSVDMMISDERFGRYFISRKAFDRASKYVLSCKGRNIFLDEVGRMEIMGGGFADTLRELLKRNINLYIAVREDFVDDVIKTFGIENPHIINANT